MSKQRVCRDYLQTFAQQVCIQFYVTMDTASGTEKHMGFSMKSTWSIEKSDDFTNTC